MESVLAQRRRTPIRGEAKSGEEINISSPSVGRAVSPTLAQVNQMRKLRAQGLSLRKIAPLVGCNRRTVSRRLYGDPRKGDLEYLERRRQKRRAEWSAIMVDGKRTWIRTHMKRPYSSICELCGCPDSGQSRGNSWHHWDDDHLEQGIWLCGYVCHAVAEGLERGVDVALLTQKYRELKSSIMEGK